MTKTFFTPALLCLLLFLVGCRRDEHQLSFHPAAGTSTLLRLDLKGRVDLDIPMAKINEPFNTTVVSGLAFDSTSEGTRMVFSFYPDSVAVPFPVNTNTIKDSNDVDFGNLFRNMKFGTLVNAQGKPGTVSGLDSLRKMINSTLGSTMPNNGSRQAMQVDSFLTDGTLTAIFELAQHVLPESPVSIGESWENESQISPGFTLMLRKKFRLEKVSGDTAFISMKAEIVQRNPGAQINAVGLGWFLPPSKTEKTVVPDNIWTSLLNQVQLDIKGNMTGDLQVDMRTGMLQQSKMFQQLQGQVKMGTFAIPVKLDMDYSFRME